MKQCVKFPEDKFLAVRSCLVAICMGNRPAANLLSILLFRYNLRMENKDDAENQNAVKAAKGMEPDQDTSVRIFRTQAQLVEDMCGEMTEKTLHDTAVPMLQLLGFLDLEEHMIANCYILHVELVQHALNLYIPGRKEQPQLEKFLISTIQLEKFLITSDELEKFLIDKKNFLSGLEKVLIQNRKISYHQRGRKLSADVPLRGKNRVPKNLEEDSKKEYKEERAALPSSNEPHALFSQTENDYHSYRHEHTRKDDAWNCEAWCHAHEKTCDDYQAWIERGGRDEPTEPRIEAIGATDGNTTRHDNGSPSLSEPHSGLRVHQDTHAASQDQHHPGGVGQFQRTSGDERDAARHQIQPRLAIASTSGRTDETPPDSVRTRQSLDTGHPTGVNHPVSSGEPASQAAPDAAMQTTSSQSASSQVPPVSSPTSSAKTPAGDRQTVPSRPHDGAASAGSGGSEPRASNGVVTQESILADWDAVQGSPQSRTDRLRKAAREGVAAAPTRDELKGCRDWLPTTDRPNKPWYRSHGVELWDVIEKLGAYRSYLALSIQPAPLADMPKPKPMDVYTANSLDKEKMNKRIEDLKARAALKGWQPHGTQ